MSEHVFARPAIEPLFERRLQPHRSLNGVQFRRLMIGFSVIATATTVPFFLLGAWPIVGFMGLDVLIFYLAFRASFRSARAYELVRLNAVSLHVEKVSAKGKRRIFRFNPLWVRLEAQEDEDFGLRHLYLKFRKQEVEVGAFLAPVERAEFAKAFQPALAQARRGPVYDHSDPVTAAGS